MPIEVRELVIKAAVAQEGEQGGATPDRGNNAVAPDEEIIRLCVERILDILKEKTER